MTQWSLSQECKVDLAFEKINAWQFHTLTKKENPMIILRNTEKDIWQNPTSISMDFLLKIPVK